VSRPRFEPQLPAPQAGTLPKSYRTVSRQFIAAYSEPSTLPIHATKGIMNNKELFRYEVDCSEPPLEKMDFTEEPEQSGADIFMIYE
jgi:hypothetical protein